MKPTVERDGVGCSTAASPTPSANAFSALAEGAAAENTAAEAEAKKRLFIILRVLAVMGIAVAVYLIMAK